ncbi:hypothetical protein [Carbonactinospora thermoautotrophica]|uniref:hypothetical protein n=1 Tax=Carbonactinospora thermoautotrophica TaxID=1469144 RepID=UPI000830D5D9|nr:hypothetical protein [Carbonactinospora thermoautotrophica]
MNGVIIAGISGAGKTTLHRAVIAALAGAGRETLLAFPQAMTTTAHLHLAGDPAAHAAALLDWFHDAVAFAERVMHQATAGGLLTHPRYGRHWTPTLVLEGFIFDIPTHGYPIPRAAVRPLERRLAALDVTLVVLRVPPDHIQRQCVESTRRHRGERWAAHLDRLGRSDAERAAHFRRWQDDLLAWVADTPLPVVQLDTSPGRWDDYTRRIVDLFTPSRHPHGSVSSHAANRDR